MEPVVESQQPFLAQTGSIRNTGYGNLSTTRSDRRFFPPNERLEHELEYLARVETPLCVITFTSVTIKEAAAQWNLSVLFHHRLLLSIIRPPDVTDDEKDRSENLSP